MFLCLALYFTAPKGKKKFTNSKNWLNVSKKFKKKKKLGSRNYKKLRLGKQQKGIQKYDFKVGKNGKSAVVID